MPKPPPSHSLQPSGVGKPCCAALAAPPWGIYSWKAAPLLLPKYEGDLRPVGKTLLFRKGFLQSAWTAVSNTSGGLRGFCYRLRTAPGHTKAASFTHLPTQHDPSQGSNQQASDNSKLTGTLKQKEGKQLPAPEIALDKPHTIF